MMIIIKRLSTFLLLMVGMKKNDFLPYLFLSGGGGGGGDDYALFGLFCVRSLPSTGHG